MEKVKLTRSQRAADAITWFCGTWEIIGIATIFIIFWIAYNIRSGHAWDPWPFIMLNGVFTIVEFYQGPFILMSENRDRERAEIKQEQDREAVRELNKKLDLIMDKLK